MKPPRRARLIGALCAAGFLDALYMLAYHQGFIGRLACPFFGEGCNIVGRSPQARHFGVPNAAAGAVGYVVMGALALAGGNRAGGPPWRGPALGVLAGGAAAASVWLTWEQAIKVRAWCFWCLTSAAINAAILPLALQEAAEALRLLRRRDPV